MIKPEVEVIVNSDTAEPKYELVCKGCESTLRYRKSNVQRLKSGSNRYGPLFRDKIICPLCKWENLHEDTNLRTAEYVPESAEKKLKELKDCVHEILKDPSKQTTQLLSRALCDLAVRAHPNQVKMSLKLFEFLNGPILD